MTGGAEQGNNDPQTQQQLLAFRRGNVDAFEHLFRLHQRAVYRWILRIVRNPAEAEDLTLETFVRIYRAHARFDPARGFEGWARTIATRAALDSMRSSRAKTALRFEPLNDPPAPAATDPAMSAEIRAAIESAMGRLPPRLRIAALLALVEERPHHEVAQALDISIAAVKLRVFRALRLLKKDLEGQGIRP